MTCLRYVSRALPGIKLRTSRILSRDGEEVRCGSQGWRPVFDRNGCSSGPVIVELAPGERNGCARGYEMVSCHDDEGVKTKEREMS